MTTQYYDWSSIIAKYCRSEEFHSVVFNSCY